MDSLKGGTESDARLERALAALSAGLVVGYPSETVWGLAALPGSREGVDRLYSLKGREAGKPVQLSCESREVAAGWVREGQEGYQRFSVLWPGPLTLLADAAPGCPPWLAPGGVVGLRVPDHPLARALLRAAGGALATTSLNPSAEPAARSWEEARAYGLADLLLPDHGAREGGQPDSGPRSSGRGSTVVDARSGEVLRAG
ncbi:MAG: L-threonylcarbamoyladenylate synthase, partial [Deinococcus sp.]